MEQNNYQNNSGYGKKNLWKWILLYVVIGALVYVGVYYFFFANKGGYNTANPYSYQEQNTMPTSTVSNPSVSSATVTYTDSGFSPETVTISKGGTVTFKNNASDDVRVASNPHPIHNGYPTTGGCVSSTFDSCKNISPGGSWSFTFDIQGSFGYHNHLNPGEGGTIVVE